MNKRITPDILLFTLIEICFAEFAKHYFVIFFFINSLRPNNFNVAAYLNLKSR